MAKRYSGDLQISVTYDDKNHYRAAVSRDGTLVWRGIVRPAPSGFGPGTAHDSPKAYDKIAAAALAFAADEGGDIDSGAEFDEQGAGYLVRRSRTVKPSHATRKLLPVKKSSAQIKREVDAALAGKFVPGALGAASGKRRRSHASMKSDFSAAETLKSLSRRFAKHEHVRDTINWISTGLLLATPSREAFAQEIRDLVDCNGPLRTPDGEDILDLALEMADAVESKRV